MSDHFSALLKSLMALQLMLVHQNPFWHCMWGGLVRLFSAEKIPVSAPFWQIDIGITLRNITEKCNMFQLFLILCHILLYNVQE